jgi:ABC-type spermidine/putrescine transport system permease subunit II
MTTLQAEAMPHGRRGDESRAARNSASHGGASLPLLALVVFVFFFMYLPMLLIVIFSFNSSQVTILPLEQFTLRWYKELLGDRKIIDAFVNTLIVGAGTTIIALLIGGSGALPSTASASPARGSTSMW